MGTYALAQPLTGLGIRDFRYDFDITNPNLETFTNYNQGGQEVHSSGTRWAATLWDLNHLLIQKYGFEPNVFDSTSDAGNIKALKLVMNALKIQPLNPSFIDARDAILMADQLLFGGADELEIWTAFARRGLGQFASTPSSNASNLTTSFEIPPEVLGLQIISSSPAANSVVSAIPTSYVIQFRDAVDVATLQASDMTVNSIPADNVALSADSKTATFTFNISPVTSEGLNTMAIAADAIERSGDNLGNLAFNAPFRYDTTLLQVGSTTPAFPGGTFSLPGPSTYDVNFNEPLDPGSVTTGSLVLSGLPGAAVTSTVLPGNTTVRFTIDGITTEGILTASIPSGSLTDQYGNLGTAFTANYSVDIGGPSPYPVPLVAKAPLGSLVYDPSYSGLIGFSGDTDTFTLSVDPGQTISVVVKPTDAALQPSVQLFDPGNGLIGSSLAAAVGMNAFISATPTGNATGTYTIVVSGQGATTGSYTLQVTLNADLEHETFLSGVENNSLATAQSLDSAFTELPSPGSTAERAAVLGYIDPGPPYSATSVPFAFENINASGTIINFSNTDNDSQSIPIGFAFNLFGVNYNSVFVSTNGLLSFGSPDASSVNTDLTSSPFEAVIAPFWDDLIVAGAGSSKVSYQLLGSGPTTHLVVQWTNISFAADSPQSGGLTFQVVLNPDGTFRFNYTRLNTGRNGGTHDNGASATSGIKDGGAQGPNRLLLMYDNGPTLVNSSRSVLFSPQQIADYDYYSLAGWSRRNRHLRPLPGPTEVSTWSCWTGAACCLRLRLSARTTGLAH